MKRILMALLAIVLISGIAGLGSWAFFSDIEESTGNVFQAGTLDISINSQNPWTASFSIDNQKPGQITQITQRVFNVTNEGSLTLNLWQKIDVTDLSGGLSVYPPAFPEASSEPEYQEGLVAGVYTESCSLDGNTNFALLVNGEVIYDLVDEVKFSDIDGWWYYLGEIGPGDSLIVTHQYQLDSAVTNWAQGDVMEFTITFYAEQLGEEALI